MRYNIVVKKKDNYQICLRGFDLTQFDNFEEGGIEELQRFPYLLIFVFM